MKPDAFHSLSLSLDWNTRGKRAARGCLRKKEKVEPRSQVDREEVGRRGKGVPRRVERTGGSVRRHPRTVSFLPLEEDDKIILPTSLRIILIIPQTFRDRARPRFDRYLIESILSRIDFEIPIGIRSRLRVSKLTATDSSDPYPRDDQN